MPPASRILIVADHPGPPQRLVRTWQRRAEVSVLTLPDWQDSALCRRMRIYPLSGQELQDVANGIARLMDLLKQVFAAGGTSPAEWQYFRQVLEAHAAVPLCEAVGLVRHHAQAIEASAIVSVANLRDPRFWSGQQVAPAAAATVARELHIPHHTHYPSPPLGMLARGQPGLWLLRKTMFVRKGKAAIGALRTSAGRLLHRRADVLFLVAGPAPERLAHRISAELAKRGTTSVVARAPFAPGTHPADAVFPLPANVQPQAYKEAMRLSTGGPARAASLADRLSSQLPCEHLGVIAVRLLSLECRDRPLVHLLNADASRLLETLRPKSVVSFTFLPRLLTAYVVAARDRGIRTVCCQHGLICGLDFPSPWFDAFAVFNRYTAALLASAVPQSAELCVVGNPWLAAVANEQPKPLRPSGAEGRPIVLVATQPNEPPGAHAEPDWWFACVARACAKLGAFVEVKLHPQQASRSDREPYERVLRRHSAVGKVIPHGQADLHRLIAGCNLFVSQFSSTILDAIALGRPVVCVDFRPGPAFYPFHEFKAAFRACSPGDVEPAMRRGLVTPATGPGDPDWQRFAERHIEPLDGRAVERMASLILGQ